MRTLPLFTALLAVSIARPLTGAEGPAPDPREILEAMGHAADGVQDYTLRLVKQELRPEGLEPEQALLVKWARPHKVYFKSLDGPQKGQEVLFARGWNRERLKAHKGSFPDITLNLDPRGSWAMAHTHHPVPETSLVTLVSLVLENFREAQDRGALRLEWLGHDKLWGRPCDRLEMSSPDEVATLTLARGETLWDVARRSGQDMYAILHRNRTKGWKGPRDPRPGDEVFVPRYYAGRLGLWIDRDLHLPLKALIYDHKGNLYERYEHQDLRINVGLTAADFSSANPEYDF